MYKQIQTLENYNILLKSGMFWEFHPELTGDWDKDKIIINGAGSLKTPKKENMEELTFGQKELIAFLSNKIPIYLLKELFNVDYERGILTYKINYRTIVKNSTAGYKNSKGYLKTEIAGKTYAIHVLIWSMFNNRFPDNNKVIDHINGNRLDNSINNLREISVQGNAQNRTNRKHKLPLYIYNHRNKYSVRITTDKARAYGSFSTIEEALAKRDEICKQLNINIY